MKTSRNPLNWWWLALGLGVAVVMLVAAGVATAAEPRPNVLLIGIDEPAMRAVRDPASGQIDLFEGDQAVLRYNYLLSAI